MRPIFVFLLFAVPTIGLAQSVDKYLHFSHGDYERTTDYPDV